MKEDRHLVEACLRGDTRAFGALVERYRYAVYGLCLGYTRDFDAAEDAAQEAFVTTFLKLRELADPDRFGPWLKRIAANACRMWMRTNRPDVPLSEADETALVIPSSAEDEMVAQETRQAVLEAIGRLTGPQQQVVTLFYLEDMSLKQIADFLGVPFQSVKQRLYRARLRLKEEMLQMVEKTLGDQRLPEDFTEKVIDEALERGRQLLEERRWPEAKAKFRNVLKAVSGHVQAQCGLAMALNGEVQDMLDDAKQPYDEKLVKEAFESFEEAYRLGARDSDTVWALVNLYQSFDKHQECLQLLETYAEKTDDPEQSFEALCKATLDADRLEDYERGIALQRRALDIDGIPPFRRLNSYLGVMVAYFETGKGDTWLSETQVLCQQLGLPLTIHHYMHYRDRASLLRRMKRYEEATQTGQHFLDLLEREPVDDPVQRRWWISDTWREIIKNCHEQGNKEGVSAALEAAQDNLRAYESEWRSAVEKECDEQCRDELDRNYRRYFGYALANLGAACKNAGLIDEAIALFERSTEVGASGPVYMFLASLRLQKGDRAGSLDALKRMYETSRRWVLGGHARRGFYYDEVFKGVRNDKEFVELIEGKGMA